MANVTTVTLYDQAIPATGNPAARLRVKATVLTRVVQDPPEVVDGVELSFYVVHPSGREIPTTEATLLNVRSLKAMP